MTINGLTGALYYVRVSARNSRGYGATIMDVEGKQVLSPPGAVTNPQWYSEPGQVVLDWDAPTLNGGQPITGYNIWLNVNGAGFLQRATMG